VLNGFVLNGTRIIRIRYREVADFNGFFLLFVSCSNRIFVISTEEKSSRETRQRLDFRDGVTCEDFSSVEMTNCTITGLKIRANLCNSWLKK
jgi:hypothetical protein